MINSQPIDGVLAGVDSISKGMGDQFSADLVDRDDVGQYIKGDG